MTTEPTSVPPTSGGATSPSDPEPEARETKWVVLSFDTATRAWIEREQRLTAGTRREAERDALKLMDAAVSVVPARSWDPKVEEPPTEPRVVDFDPWAGA